jgi:hypothetical protein
MDFDVNFGVQITSLGVFDSSGDGLIGTLQARLYDRDTELSVADLVFTAGSPGILLDGSRFLNLATPLILSPGFHGVISVAYLGDPVEMNANSAGGTPIYTTDNGGGLISFIGVARHSDPGTGDLFPNVLDGGPENRYAAGTFIYSAVPEPTMMGLFLLGAVGFWLRRR